MIIKYQEEHDGKYIDLERSTTGLAEVLGAGETAAALVQGVHAGGAAYRGLEDLFVCVFVCLFVCHLNHLARESSTGAGEGEGD